MNPELQKALARAAVSLQSTNAPAWDHFMTALTARLDHITEALVAASTPSETALLQGRAREIRDLFKELAGARELVEKLQKQERTNATTPRQP